MHNFLIIGCISADASVVSVFGPVEAGAADDLKIPADKANAFFDTVDEKDPVEGVKLGTLRSALDSYDDKVSPDRYVKKLADQMAGQLSPDAWPFGKSQAHRGMQRRRGLG